MIHLNPTPGVTGRTPKLAQPIMLTDAMLAIWVCRCARIATLIAARRAEVAPRLYRLGATNRCVTGDTRVATPQGWRRADEIETGDEIFTVNGPEHVVMIESHPALPVYDVHFSDGGIVRTTAAHQFYVCDPDEAALRPRRVDHLKKGDRVRVFRDGVLDGAAAFVHVEPAGLARVYDLYEPKTDTWITEGYVSRGCGE